MEKERENREQLALKHIVDFVKRARKLIEGIKAEHLVEGAGINPYMIAALGINSIEEVVELFVYRRVERSLGTSFGSAIEAFLRDLLGGVSGKQFDNKGCKKQLNEKSWICWWDIIIPREFKKSKKVYKGVVISVKSGSADINKDILERFIQHAKVAEQQGYKPYLFLTYGKQAFSIVNHTLRNYGMNPDNYVLVGRQIFKEFFEDPNYYEHLLEIIRSASGSLDIFTLIENKIAEIAEELKKKYGNDIEKLLKDLS